MIFVFFNISKMIELETQHFIVLSVATNWDRVDEEDSYLGSKYGTTDNFLSTANF